MNNWIFKKDLNLPTGTDLHQIIDKIKENSQQNCQSEYLSLINNSSSREKGPFRLCVIRMGRRVHNLENVPP